MLSLIFKDKDGRRALHIAAQQGHLEVVQVLLKVGAVIGSKDEYGIMAFHFAANGGHLEVFDVLLKFGNVIDSKDKDGRTALTLLLNKVI